jgi:hypothetical protein
VVGSVDVYPLKLVAQPRFRELKIEFTLGSIMSQVLALSFDDAIAILDRYEATSITPKDKASENPVAMFMRAHTIPDESAKEVAPAMLFKIYRDWSLFRGIKPVSLSTFNRRLDDMGLRPKVVLPGLTRNCSA